MPQPAPKEANGEPDGGLESPGASTDGRPLGNLPLELSSFVGRGKEVAEVGVLLAGNRLLTLSGPGGSGKTRLALAVAHEVVEKYGDGAWFVELAPLSDPELVPQAVASLLGVRETPGRELTDTLTDHLRPRTLLLVLDNCEHLIGASASLAEALLRSCPNLRVLATSRQALGVEGEALFVVPPLSLPDPRRLPVVDGLHDYEAARLFVERARAVWPRFEVTERNATAVAQICHRLDGMPLLDVATGSGNTAISAARRYADVTGLDYVPGLIEQARVRAGAEGLEVAFVVGDAEDLPFAEASFDVALSTVGVMFAPDQEKTASELLRVTRPGGRIGLANWTPDGFIGNMFKTVGRHFPPPPSIKPPPLWGTEVRLRELFGDEVSSLTTTRRTYNFRFLSAEHLIDTFRTYYGPVHKAFEALDTEGRDAFAKDLEELIHAWNTSGDGTAVVPSDYLEVVGVRR